MWLSIHMPGLGQGLLSDYCISRRGAENAEKRTLLFKRNRQYQAEGMGQRTNRRQYAVGRKQKTGNRKQETERSRHGAIDYFRLIIDYCISRGERREHSAWGIGKGIGNSKRAWKHPFTHFSSRLFWVTSIL